MKKTIAAWAIPLVMMMTGVELAADNIMQEGKQIQKSEMMDVAASTMYLMQIVTKDYLYIGSNVKSPVLESEMLQSLASLDSITNRMRGYCSNNSELEGLLESITMGSDELKSILKEEYSLDNIKLVMDVTGYISNAVLTLVKKMDKEIIVYNSLSSPFKYLGSR